MTGTVRRHGAEVEIGAAGIRVCRPGIVRVPYASDRSSTPSLVAPRDWAPAPFGVVEGEPVRLVTSALRLEVETTPLRLSFADAEGAPLLREPAGDDHLHR